MNVSTLVPKNVALIIGVVVLVALAFFAGTQNADLITNTNVSEDLTTLLEERVIPKDGVTLPIIWGDTGKRLVEVGVINAETFEAIYASRGGLKDEERELLYGDQNGELHITRDNSGVLLNLLWAFGLGNKNQILEKGPMTDSQYGGAGRFASTGGWTVSNGDAMNHYSAHSFVILTPEEQGRVERVAKGIYRPCCGNSTYFPDCNHGMAMLGLLELLASQGSDESTMYRTALVVNSYWFPSTYLTIATYVNGEDVVWQDVDPRKVLGYDFSSGAGYRNVLSQVEQSTPQGGPGCAV